MWYIQRYRLLPYVTLVYWSAYSLSNGKHTKAFLDFETILHNIDFASFARLFICFVSRARARQLFMIYDKRARKCYELKIGRCPTVFENHRKSLIQHCEQSELRLHFEWTKVNQNGPFWRVFEILKLAVKQCYQTGQF